MRDDGQLPGAFRFLFRLRAHDHFDHGFRTLRSKSTIQSAVTYRYVMVRATFCVP